MSTVRSNALKKRWRRVLPAVLVPVLAVFAAGLVYAFPMFRMSPTPTGPVGDSGIVALNNGPNSLYFIPAEHGYLLVDAGTSTDRVAQSLPKIEIDPSEVSHILLTHSDSDHVASLSLFPDAQVFLGVDEFPLLSGTTKRNAVSRNTLPQGLDILSLTLLQDGQTLELGGLAVTCIAAPGHTPGSVAFLVDGRYLFTGDAFRAGDDGLSPHPYTMDKGEAQQSIDRLTQAMNGTELVLTAHYGWFAAGDLQSSEGIDKTGE